MNSHCIDTGLPGTVVGVEIEDIPVTEVAAFLRDARKSDGLTPDAVVEWLAGYDVSCSRASAELVVSEFESATSLVPNKGWRSAIRNALGFQGKSGNLTDRRMEYLSKEDVSLSTLIRHEDAGADQTAEMFQAMRQGKPQVYGANLDQVVEMLAGIEESTRDWRTPRLSDDLVRGDVPPIDQGKPYWQRVQRRLDFQDHKIDLLITMVSLLCKEQGIDPTRLDQEVGSRMPHPVGEYRSREWVSELATMYDLASRIERMPDSEGE